MKINHEYSHLGGMEILKVRYPECDRIISEIIVSVSPKRADVIGDTTIPGHALYSSVELNARFLDEFVQHGLHMVSDTASIRDLEDNVASKRPGARDKVMVDVGFTDYPTMFYSLVNFQRLFGENLAEVGVLIVPCQAMKNYLPEGMSTGERLISDIQRLKPHFPLVPVKIVLVDADDVPADGNDHF
ncbi:MAG: BstYI [Anaerolineae bacterium]|nr:BstYI [Anaerolineae bacterium]MCB0257646.1 BstYI [Anaerolineae bacterium]